MVGTMFKVLALAAATLQFVAASPAPALVTIVVPAGLAGESTALSGVIAGVNSLSQTTYIVSASTVIDSTPVAATVSLNPSATPVTVVEGSDYVSYTAVLAEPSTTLGAVGGIGGYQRHGYHGDVDAPGIVDSRCADLGPTEFRAEWKQSHASWQFRAGTDPNNELIAEGPDLNLGGFGGPSAGIPVGLNISFPNVLA
ncbi:hypothetical protein FB451DRAFT_1181336 [Mycena latifolia]|nr:hypothetical protein FB451DRAFT_1181336 [Mycena latifolia]